MSSREKKFSILFVGSQMEVAGAQRVLLSQARWFSEHGNHVQAVFFYDKQGLAKKWQRENAFPVISLNSWRYGAFPILNFFRLLGGLLRLFRLMRRDVDVVESFTPHSNVLAMPLAWLAGAPVRIATHHGYIEGSSGLLARVHGWLMNSRLTSKVVAVSSQVRDYAIDRENILAEKLQVIENGIEALEVSKIGAPERAALRKELGVATDDVLLLTVGRLTVQKGHTVLLKAIAKIPNDSPSVVFAFAGEGKQREILKSEATALGISDRIRFLGVRKDIAQLLLASDIFVQPSLWEGLSLAMLEALLSGIPVLATKVEGVVDVIENEQHGILVSPDDADALAEGVSRLIGDKKLRTRLGRAGQSHAERHYSIDKMCGQYEELMQQLWQEAQE
jgi:glycosyltransferase involved in cell wall biosynthesis